MARRPLLKAGPQRSCRAGAAYRCVGPLLAALLAFGAIAGAPAAQAQSANSASHIEQWVSIDQLLAFTDADLDRFRSWGVGGFTAGYFRLASMGGSERFTGDPDLPALATAPEYATQRRIRDSNIAARLRARGMTLALQVYASNYLNASTPFWQWNDDVRWAGALPDFQDFAAMMRLYGIQELIFDLEEYPTQEKPSGPGFTWAWNYPATRTLPANTASESATRAKVRERGAQIMGRLLAGYPGISVGAYYLHVPGTHREWAYRVTANTSSSEPFLETDVGGTSPEVFRNFMDGLTSVDGYSRFRLLDEAFYKAVFVPQWTWDQAYRHFLQRWHARMSRLMSNWDYLASRLVGGGFVWPDPGSAPSEGFRGAGYVGDQMAAAARWSEGGIFDVYGQHFPGDGTFSYEAADLIPIYQSAATPRVVDSEPPTVGITSSTVSGDAVTIRGSASDDFAVRRVSWVNSAGGAGECQMTPVWTDAGSATGRRTEFDKAIPLVAGAANTITITAEDIHGLARSATVTLTAESGATAARRTPGRRRARRSALRVRLLRTARRLSLRTARRDGIHASFVVPSGVRVVEVRLLQRRRMLVRHERHVRRGGARQTVRLRTRQLRRRLGRGRYTLAVRVAERHAALGTAVTRSVLIH